MCNTIFKHNLDVQRLPGHNPLLSASVFCLSAADGSELNMTGRRLLLLYLETGLRRQQAAAVAGRGHERDAAAYVSVARFCTDGRRCCTVLCLLPCLSGAEGSS